MHRFRQFAVLPLVLVLGVVVTAVTTRVTTGVALTPQNPAVVGVLNLDRLLSGLDRAEVMKEKFRIRQEAIVAAIRAKKENLDQDKTDAEALQGTPEYETVLKELRRREAMLAAEQAYEVDMINMQDAQAMQTMYMEIVGELKTFCETNSIDLVVIDSSPPAAGFPRSNDGRILANQQTLQAIASWETMYVSPDIDITNDFMAYMNR